MQGQSLVRPWSVGPGPRLAQGHFPQCHVGCLSGFPVREGLPGDIGGDKGRGSWKGERGLPVSWHHTWYLGFWPHAPLALILTQVLFPGPQKFPPSYPELPEHGGHMEAPHLMEGSKQRPCDHGTPALGGQGQTKSGKMTSESPASSKTLGALFSDFLILS